MKLFMSPGTCALNPHIVLHELGIPFEAEAVDIRAHKTQHGNDYYGVNPKGYVPALMLDDGQLLTEGPAITQYLADAHPEKNLVPKPGTLERARLNEWLTFIGTEIHKSFWPFFALPLTDELKGIYHSILEGRFAHVAKQLEGKDYLLGKNFSVADSYLFVMMTWAKGVAPKAIAHPVLEQYFERVKARPGVSAALAAEEKLKAANKS